MTDERTPEAIAAALDEWAAMSDSEGSIELRAAAAALRRLSARCAEAEASRDYWIADRDAACVLLEKAEARCAALEQEQAASIERVRDLAEDYTGPDIPATWRAGYLIGIDAAVDALSTPSEEPQR